MHRGITGGASSLAQSLVHCECQPEAVTVSVTGDSVEVSLPPQPEFIRSPALSSPLPSQRPSADVPHAWPPPDPHPRQPVLSEQCCLPWLYLRHERSSAQWGRSAWRTVGPKAGARVREMEGR